MRASARICEDPATSRACAREQGSQCPRYSQILPPRLVEAPLGSRPSLRGTASLNHREPLIRRFAETRHFRAMSLGRRQEVTLVGLNLEANAIRGTP